MGEEERRGGKAARGGERGRHCDRSLADNVCHALCSIITPMSKQAGSIDAVDFTHYRRRFASVYELATFFGDAGRRRAGFTNTDGYISFTKQTKSLQVTGESLAMVTWFFYVQSTDTVISGQPWPW